jgi:hypothetical protein
MPCPRPATTGLGAGTEAADALAGVVADVSSIGDEATLVWAGAITGPADDVAPPVAASGDAGCVEAGADAESAGEAAVIGAASCSWA